VHLVTLLPFTVCVWLPTWFSLWFHCTSVSNASGFARIMYRLDLITHYAFIHTTHIQHSVCLYLSLCFFSLFCLWLFVCNVARKHLLVDTILLTSEYEQWKNGIQIMMYGLFGFHFLLYFWIFAILVAKTTNKCQACVEINQPQLERYDGYFKAHGNFKLKTYMKSHHVQIQCLFSRVNILSFCAQLTRIS